MNDTARQTLLTELHEGGRRMLALARNGDWVAVSRLQAEQHTTAERIFAEPVDPEDAAHTTETIKAVIDINDQITALGLEARKGCLQAVGEQQQRRHALQQYSANSK